VQNKRRKHEQIQLKPKTKRKNKNNSCLSPQSGSEERVHGAWIGCALSAPKLWKMFKTRNSGSEKKIYYWNRKVVIQY